MKKWIFVMLGAVMLFIIYLTQKELQQWFDSIFQSRYTAFVFSRTTRFLLNDLCVILMIYGIFGNKRYVLFAFYVQLAGIILVLMPYMVLKYFNNYNGPLISFLHRLIVNPLLMILLIPAFYYQNKLQANE